MSSVPEGNRYAPPSAHVEDVVAAGTIELAGRGARFGAALIDGLLIMAVFWAISLVTPWSPFAAASGEFSSALLLNGVLGIAIFALLQGYLLATRGQTIGKLLLGMRIVRTSGERAGLARLLGLRYGIGWLINVIPVAGPIYGLVDALFIFRESRKCVHDIIADTVVVNV
jgi:uncharacterized RDD family membrane protein YckC